MRWQIERRCAVPDFYKLTCGVEVEDIVFPAFAGAGFGIDERRFRMNVIVSTEEIGFVENNWVGRDLTIGDAVRLNVALRASTPFQLNGPSFHSSLGQRNEKLITLRNLRAARTDF